MEKGGIKMNNVNLDDIVDLTVNKLKELTEELANKIDSTYNEKDRHKILSDYQIGVEGYIKDYFNDLQKVLEQTHVHGELNSRLKSYITYAGFIKITKAHSENMKELLPKLVYFDLADIVRENYDSS